MIGADIWMRVAGEANPRCVVSGVPVEAASRIAREFEAEVNDLLKSDVRWVNCWAES